jgi:hypothetical protein
VGKGSEEKVAGSSGQEILSLVGDSFYIQVVKKQPEMRCPTLTTLSASRWVWCKPTSIRDV